MNTDPDFPLIDRYLDGVATQKESAALAEAVEADADVLAALCAAAAIEASLRRHLATPEQRRAMTPRIVPLWHWPRAGKWIAAGAAAAALMVTSAIVFWPAKPGGTGKPTIGLASGMTVKRLTGDARGTAAPAQAPPAHESAGPMEEVEFPVHAQWLKAMSNVRPPGTNSIMLPTGLAEWLKPMSNVRPPGTNGISWPTGLAGVFEIPVRDAAGRMILFSRRFENVSAEVRIRTDDFLVWYLRACGVTFPHGASARWLPDQDVFVTLNTSENIERITRLQLDPAGMGAKQVIIEPQLWRIPEGVTVPALLQEERILTAAEVNDLLEITSARDSEVRLYRSGNMAPSETQRHFFLHGGSDTDFLGDSGPPSSWDRVHAQLQLNQWRVGDHVIISGLAGPRPDANAKALAPNVQNPGLEFDLTLASGEAAVLHLGRTADGTDSILMLCARIGDFGTNTSPITVGNIPNVMKFDQPLLTVKAGFPVRLLHKNDACVLPHNFVLVKPGTAAAVGALADQIITDPDGLAKLYIPVSPDILVTGKRLLKHGESEEILFTAPSEPGDYPYLCTFPGHWRLQQGILRVER